MSSQPNDHETGLLKFVLPPQQRRLAKLFELGSKRRRDVRSLLDHAIKLDPRYVRPLAGGDQFPDKIVQILRSFGAPRECFVVSANPGLDGRQMPLSEALEAIVGSGNGAFVSCLAGELGYFEYEHMDGGHVLSTNIAGRVL